MDFLTLEPLEQYSWLAHGFTTRQSGIDVKTSKSEALERLQGFHQLLVKSQGISWEKVRFAEQIHGHEVAKVPFQSKPMEYPGVDGLITAEPNVPLGIYVADCCAIFLVETQRRAIGILHSGRKGTEEQIARKGIHELLASCQGSISTIVAVLSPCIHKCCYDSDFRTEIEQQLRDEGVPKIWRHPDCTGCNLDRYYSYRKEKGQTGRMLAFMMVRSE
jgi:polyphenol oxidase